MGSAVLPIISAAATVASTVVPPLLAKKPKSPGIPQSSETLEETPGEKAAREKAIALKRRRNTNDQQLTKIESKPTLNKKTLLGE